MPSPAKGVVREFEVGDLPFAVALLAEEIRTGVANFHWEPVSVEELECDWRACTTTRPWLSLTLDGCWAGFASATAYKGRAAYRFTCEVGIYLEAHARGCGLGRVLYQALLETLAERGFHRAIASIALPGEASSALHAALGVQRIGVLREVGWKLGAWRDVAIWQRCLVPRARAVTQTPS